MRNRGIQLAISTLILIIIGLAVLVGLILFLTGSFESFRESTEPIEEGFVLSGIKESCEIACNTENRLTYCCNEFDAGEFGNLKCDDSRLELDCSLSCDGFNC